MLMKLTSDANFINVFTCSFYACRTQRHKKLLELTVFIALLGSVLVKSAHKMLMKEIAAATSMAARGAGAKK